MIAQEYQEQHQLAKEFQEAGLRVGRPEVWLPVQAATFTLALDEGLDESMTVLDVGSGLFRVGKPFIELVGLDRYAAIEPDRSLTAAGQTWVLGGAAVNHSTTRSFDFQVFGMKFDFIIARSIWSHSSRAMIRKMLDEFLIVGNPDAVFLASFYDANWWNPRRWPYYGSKWLYKGQTIRPASRHRRAWIRRECRKRGLEVDFRSWIGLGQPWAIVRKP